MRLLCSRSLRFSISCHLCFSESLDLCRPSAPQNQNSVGRRSGLESSGSVTVRPNQPFNKLEKPRTFEKMHGRKGNGPRDAMQRSSSVVPKLNYKVQFPSISESVNLSGKGLGQMRTKVELAPRTIDSPQPAGSFLETCAFTSPRKHGITLEFSRQTGRGSVGDGLNDNEAFGYEGEDGAPPYSVLHESSGRRTVENAHLSPMAVDLSQPAASPLKSRSYTRMENTLSSLASMNKQTGHRSEPPSLNTKSGLRIVNVCPPAAAIHNTDSELFFKETWDVKEGYHLHTQDPHTSSHLKSTAAQLKNISLPTQFSKRSIDYGGMYHTQAPSYQRGRWSGNSNRPQYWQKMKPFDICESSYGASSFSKNKVVWVKKIVTDGARKILRTGMVLLKNYIPLDDQVKMVRMCRELGLGEGGFYQPGFDRGTKLHLQMMCLGLDWDPQTKKYGKMRHLDGARPPAIPRTFISLTEKAIQEAHNLIKMYFEEGNLVDILPYLRPNICIVNFYDTSGRLGLHQDKDESRESLQKGLPVVSVSLGDSAEFLYSDQRDIDKAEKIILECGDVLIFGGSSRHIFHGVASVVPDSAPAAFRQVTGLRPGRLNLTFREF